jgi:hypothetical protein
MENEKSKLLNSYLQQQAGSVAPKPAKPTKPVEPPKAARPVEPQKHVRPEPPKPTRPVEPPKPAEAAVQPKVSEKYSLVKGDFKVVNTVPQEKITNVVKEATGPTGLITLDDITLEDFKNYVKKWLEMDAYLKRAMEVVKEKKKQRNKLAEVITRFMCKYNIEDLNTKEGRIRCKTSYIREPVTQKVIKAKMTELLPERKDIVTKIYDERPKHERLSLKRLKIT